MATVSRGSLKATTALNFILGVWLFFSPWIYEASGNPDAWNSWIFGGLIALFAAIRFANPAAGRGLSVMNMLFGAWIFFSPWIYGYTVNDGRFANSIIVGLVVFALGIYGSASVAPLVPRPPHVTT